MRAYIYLFFMNFGVILWLRTRKINRNIRKQIFINACCFLESIDLKMNLSGDEKIIEDILKRKDYISWKIYAIYKMFEIKYGV